MKVVNIGVFIYNEEENVETIFLDIINQDIFLRSDIKVSIYFLVNGSTDRSIQIVTDLCERYRKYNLKVCNFEQSGKSRTWNRFVHEISDEFVDVFIMLDADIRIREAHVFSWLVDGFDNDPELRVLTSRPVKDIDFAPAKLSLVQKLISKGGGTANNWKTSVCGQLYSVRGVYLKNLWMPIGLPVEDGFLRAMVLTDFLTSFRENERIGGNESVFHIYKSIMNINELFKHQTRIIVGSAINAEIFRILRNNNFSSQEAGEFFQKISLEEDWIERIVSNNLPKVPYGYVPFHFIFKRIRNILQDGIELNRIPVLFIGTVFDMIIYILASVRMARGVKSGYW